MRRWMNVALAGLLAIGMAETAGAAPLSFTGTLEIGVTIFQPPFVITGAGTAEIAASGAHLVSLGLPGGTFGPLTTVTNFSQSDFLPNTLGAFAQSLQNEPGAFSGLSGPAGGGTMGLTGLLRVCLGIDPTCAYIWVPIPVSPSGDAGFGIGGTQTASGGGVSVTAQHAPWTRDLPMLTVHTTSSAVIHASPPGNAFRHQPGSTTQPFPTGGLPGGGFAHGPASLTSSTAQPGGVLQLVTVSKVFTNLTSGFPEFLVTSTLTLHFVPEPGTLLLLGAGAGGLAALGRSRRRKR